MLALLPSTLLHRTTAFAARLCVLATRVGGMQEVVEEGKTGIFVDPGNSAQLAGAIKRLLGDPAQRQELASSAFNRSRDDYDWETVAGRFEDLYRHVIGSG